MIQHTRILHATPSPILVHALREDLLRLRDLYFERLQLRRMEGRVAAVALVEAVARQALHVLRVVLEARGAQFFEVAPDLAFGIIDDPVSVFPVS